MAYLPPGGFTRRIANRWAMHWGLGGAETLVLTTRSGNEQRIPVITVTFEDGRYLVSTRGESSWVKNLRAAGVGELRTKSGVVRFAAAEVAPEGRPGVIAAYREKAGGKVKRYFEKLPDPADHPVFHIEEIPPVDLPADQPVDPPVDSPADPATPPADPPAAAD